MSRIRQRKSTGLWNLFPCTKDQAQSSAIFSGTDDRIAAPKFALARKADFKQSTSIESIQWACIAKPHGAPPGLDVAHVFGKSGPQHGNLPATFERNLELPVKKSTPSLPRRRSSAQHPGRLSSPPPGQYTLREILSQPAIWADTARHLEEPGTLAHLSNIFSPRSPWLFIGCGSSYYLSQLIAALWTKHFYIPATSVPASELLFAPQETLHRTGAEQVVLVSRSGETTEVLRAAELLQSHKSVITLGVTCNSDGPLEKLCTHTFKLPWADEKSTVMTRSFTTLLLAFQRLALAFIGDTQLSLALDRLPEKAQAWLDANAGKIQQFAAKWRFADFVFLGQGAHYWLAQEAGLKVTEMSSSYAQVYHTLEFRHGPRSIASRDTLITFLLSDAAAEEESLLVGELKELGAATCVIANHVTPALRKNTDLLIELAINEPEFARYAVAAIPAHLLGIATGLRKGLNPDAPKNLTRAVVLGSDGDTPAKRRGA
jgi:glucosamine--fructose-6-phosphate aminotransferase (isomerizing)